MRKTVAAALALFVATSLLSAVDVSSVEKLKPALPAIPDHTFSLADFGAAGDGKTVNTEAFAKAIAAVEKAGGGTLVVPRGVYITLPFLLCSSLDLHLADGAVIRAPETFTAAGLPEPTALRSQDEVREKVKVPEPLISGKNLHDVAITGSGTIDGSGAHWWAWSERAARQRKSTEPGRIVYPRPNLVVLDNCQRVHVADVTLTNSPKFHLVPRDVVDLTIERIKVRAPFDAPNTDAIDPGPGRNFLIRDCDIDTGDDDIVIKRGGTNILIENCTIKHGHGISIGSGTDLGVSTMLVRNCTFDGTDNGIRIKSMRGAGGLVENIRYTGITMKNVDNAILIDLNYVDNNRPDFKGDPKKIPAVRQVLIDNVTVTGSRNAGRIVGLPDSRITGVTLRDVRITAEKDLVVRDADEPACERVVRDIRKGVAPPKPKMVE
jgi:polygalacturonase